MSSLTILLRFFHEFIEELVDLLFVSQILLPDHALVIDIVESRPARDIPRSRYVSARTFLATPEGAPGNLLFFVLFFEELFVGIAIDADECKGLAFHPFDERPLVWEHCHAGASPMPPEIKHHDLTTIITEFELLTIHVFAFDLGYNLSNLEIAEFKEVGFGTFAERAPR